ncbi:MAG: hypothetical protein ACM357_10330 [Gemmatimonadota bacterium]
MPPRRPISLLVALVLAPRGLEAQGAPDVIPAFGSIGVSASATAHAALSRNLDPWDAGPGLELRAVFPFYEGTVELGASQSSFDSREAGVPGFRARFLFIGWGLGARALDGLTWRTGIRLGVYDLQFDDPAIPDYARSENEVATELVGDLGFGVGRGWSLIAGAGGRVVFTAPRMRQLTVTAGLRRSFVTPEWLRDFFD